MLNTTAATAHLRADLARASGAPGVPSSSAVRLSSVVSTFLVSFGVVVAAIAAVVHVVLNGPDQPATIRSQSFRSRDHGRRPAKPPPRQKGRPAPVGESATPASTILLSSSPVLALPDSDVMRLRVLPARRDTLWVRIRSAVALVVLVAILGALLALAIAALGLGLVLLVRSATG
jgi:hypothetical protein